MGAMWGDSDWNEKTKHLKYTFKCFRRWGHDVGFIGGQIKEKFGEPRWYASLAGIKSLHDMFKVGHVAYRWSPEQGPKYMMLDFINNISMFFFGLPGIFRLTIQWQILCYNIAYWLPMRKYPGQAYEILSSADWDELLWFKPKQWARKKGIEAGTLDWLLEIEAKEVNSEDEG